MIRYSKLLRNYGLEDNVVLCFPNILVLPNQKHNYSGSKNNGVWCCSVIKFGITHVVLASKPTTFILERLLFIYLLFCEAIQIKLPSCSKLEFLTKDVFLRKPLSTLSTRI
jgi:hypothetical protein